MIIVSSALQQLADRLNPYEEILEWGALERERMNEARAFRESREKARAPLQRTKEEQSAIQEGIEIPIAQRIRELQEKELQERKHIRSLWISYYNGLSREIASTSEDFISFCSARKPSDMACINLITVSGHMIGSLAPTTTINMTSALAQGLEEISEEVKELKKCHPDLEAALDQELRIGIKIRTKTLMVKDLYLNSLDIPIHIKALYPSAEMPESMFKKIGSAYCEKSGVGNLFGVALGVVEPKNRFINWLSRHDKTATAYIILAILPTIPFLIMESLYKRIGRMKNRVLSNRADWIPRLETIDYSDEEMDTVIRSKGQYLGRFGVYFKYHPESDRPIDLSKEEFNPTPEVNPQYFPRKLFKQKVGELYEAMNNVIRYYRTHEVPLENDLLMLFRSRMLDTIANIDKLVEKSS